MLADKKKLEKVIIFTGLLLIVLSICSENKANTDDSALSFSCETSTVLSVDSTGELKQFLPGKIHFALKDSILTFGSEGYITEEELKVNVESRAKFYSFKPGRSLLFENGLFHHVVSTFQGITAVQARCIGDQND